MGITKMSKVGFKSASYLKSDSFLVGNAAFNPVSYESIATAIGTGSSSTITFSSIPATFKHLQIRALFKGTSSLGGYADLSIMGVNGDTTATNYYTHYLSGDGTAAGAGASNSNTSWMLVSAGGASSSNGAYSAHVIDILDYADTNKYKTMRGFAGIDTNSNGGVVLSSLLWKNTNAISSITISNTSIYFGNFTTSSHFALYGIKG